MIAPTQDNFLEFDGGDIFGDITAGGGWVWVATTQGLMQVDPDSMTATWHTGLAPGRPIVYAFDSVWTAGLGNVNRVDPATLEVIASIPIPGHAEGMVATADGIWATQHHAGTITRIDPGSNQILETVTVAEAGERGPMDPSVIDGDIWFVVPRDDALVRIDPDRNVTRTALPAEAGFLAPVATAEAIWLTNMTRTFTRIDRTTGAVTLPSLPLEFARFGGLGAGVDIEGTPWFPTSDTVMVAVDPITSQVTASVPLRGAIPRSTAVFENALWVMSEAGGSLERIPLQQLVTTD